MTAINQLLEDIYASLKNDNDGLDPLIAQLKASMQSQNLKEVEIDPARLVQPNRQGRKMLQSYFKQRGVAVSFKDLQS